MSTLWTLGIPATTPNIIFRPFTPEKRPIQHSPHVQLLREDLKNKENNKEIIK